MGIVTIIIFLGTGVYMRMNFPELYRANEIIRYQFRANHIYILFSGLLNIATGLYEVSNETGWRRALQTIGTVSLLISPLFLVLAFFIEPMHASPVRPLTFFGVVFSLTGVGFHFIGRFHRKRQNSNSIHQ